ncbi:MAG TPA: DUF167 domain-containing protein [Parachlamydiales bacterium]|nr:DUF167 domain-containing protein [Parachlamydiales bacterium]
MLLQVKVTPNALKNQIVGWKEEVLQVKVTATPEKGKANEAVIELLSEALRIPKSRVRLVSGVSARLKRVEILGLSELEVKKILEQPEVL